MTKERFLFKSLVLVGLLWLGIAQTAKADTLSPTTTCTSSTVSCFEGVSVTSFDNGFKISSTNPLTTTDTVNFLVTDGTQESVSLVCTSNCVDGGNTASLFGAQVFTGSTTAPFVSNTSTPFVFNSDSDSICEGGACNTTHDPLDNFSITLTSPDSFEIDSASITMTFALPSGSPVSTPEPSTLLLLGAGSLALLGFGLRHKAVI